MANPARRTLLTDEEYLAIERSAETKSEFYDGVMYAMSGTTYRHTRIVSNLLTALNNQMREGPCEAVANDLRVALPGSSFAYPDIVVVCGEPRFRDDEFDTLLNPQAIVEVLSPSTQRWDRGGKFAYYQQLPTLRHYVLVGQESPAVEHFDRQDDGAWPATQPGWPDGVLTLDSIGVAVPLREIYRRVFDPGELA